MMGRGEFDRMPVDDNKTHSKSKKNLLMGGDPAEVAKRFERARVVEAFTKMADRLIDEMNE